MKSQVLRWVALVILGWSFSSCKPVDPYVEAPISGPVSLDDTGKEFLFEEPFNPVRQVVKICFAYSNQRIYAESNSSPPTFPKFGDGRRLEITASIISEVGKEYQLDHVANSTSGYLCLRPELNEEWLNISKSNTSFISLRVRSNYPVSFDKIEWLTFNTWDL